MFRKASESFETLSQKSTLQQVQMMSLFCFRMALTMSDTPMSFFDMNGDIENEDEKHVRPAL